jgi:release factor glutamine methyltransferase
VNPTSPLRESLRFGALDIAFDGRLLRPRTWTVAQSMWAAELLPRVPEGRVLELCAGAGHIGLLAIAASPRPLVAVDLNPVACAYITQNADAAGLCDWVEVRQGPVEDVLTADERFSLAIADPPWVPRSDVGRFPDDPRIAIDGGSDGLDIARTCVRAIGAHLVPGGAAILQLGSAEQVAMLADDVAAAGLTAVESRTFERGALVRLDRT